MTIASAPEKTFQYVAPLTCPNGAVEYQQYRASYNRPGEYSFNVECVTADGTRTDISLPSIGYALLGFYLACFLPLCIPGALIAIIVPLFFLRGKNRTPRPVQLIVEVFQTASSSTDSSLFFVTLDYEQTSIPF